MKIETSHADLLQLSVVLVNIIRRELHVNIYTHTHIHTQTYSVVVHRFSSQALSIYINVHIIHI